MKSQKRSLPLQVKLLGVVSLLNDAASEMILPLLPAFITGTLGLGAHVLGIMEGAAELVASVGKLVFGWWSDKLGKRKPLAVIGYAIAAVVRPLFAFASAGWHVVAIRATDRIGKGIRTAPRDALLANSIEPERRAEAFGFHRAMDNAGAFLGPLLALLLLSVLGLTVSNVFLLTAIPGALAVLVLAFGVKEDSQEKQQLKDENQQTNAATEPQIVDKRNFAMFLVAMVVFTLGNSSDVFLVLYAHELGVPVALAPLLWMVLSAARAAFATHGGRLADKIGKKRAIVIGWGIYALAYIGFALASKAWMIWPLFVFYGVFYGLTEGAERALTADFVPKSKRGLAYGLFHLSIGASALPASVVAGYLWEAFGAFWALSVGAALAGVASLIMAVGVRAR